MRVGETWMERIIGVKSAWTFVAFCEVVAAIIFLVALFWPGMTMANMVRGGLIGGFWAVMGLLQVLVVFSRRHS